MVSESVFAGELAVIIVTAAAIGFVGKQTGQPTIIAYILAGLLLGPAALSLVSPDQLTETMAELGLAFLLFLVGIKMRFEDIEHVLAPVVRIALPQLALVGAAGGVLAIALGFDAWSALLIGLAMMYSSTAVVVKLLADKDEVTSLPGKLNIGILLVQDVVVVILLAVLATGRPDGPADIAATLATILGLLAVIGLGALASSRYLLPDVFRQIADNKDVFLVVAVSWAFLFVLVADALELSIEMGAFLAGVALAQLPYSTELQDRVSPLTDLFVLVFFVSVGLQLDAADLLAHWEEALIAAIVIIPIKFAIFYGLISWQGFDAETAFIGSANMIQVSEFGLVVGAVAVSAGLIDEPVLGFLSLVALLTMGVSVYTIQYNHQLAERVLPYLGRSTDADGLSDRGLRRDHAVVIGLDEITRAALPVLSDWYDDVVVIDRKVSHVEALESAGYDVVFGDFRHSKIRSTAGLSRAEFVLSSSADRDVNEALLREVADDAIVFVEAEWATDARDLYDLGAHYVLMSTHLAADRLAELIARYFEQPDAFARTIERQSTELRRARSRPDELTRIGGSTSD